MSRSQKLRKNKSKLLNNCMVNGFTVNFVLIVPTERKPSINVKTIDIQASVQSYIINVESAAQILALETDVMSEV